MSLRKRIEEIARKTAQDEVRIQAAVLNSQNQTCNIVGKVTKTTVEEGSIILTVLMPDGSTITANASGSSRAVGPGSTVLVINGYVLL